ncbi:MAG: lipopolysaccharide biosynthesis protein, partial [Anaerolineae bacterium]
VPVALLPEARYVLVGAAAVGAVEGLFTPARAALDGVGRMDLNNGIDTVQRVASAAGVFIVLHLGWGLEGLIWKNLVLALAAGAVYHVALRRTVAGLSGFELAVERRRLRELAAFGRHIQVINLSGVAVEVGSKMVLSRIAGLPAVAAYEVASRVTGQIGGALLAAASALFPAAAEVRSAARVSVSALAHRAAAAGSRVEHRLVELCRRATTYTGWLALPTYALLAVLAQDFVNAWLGPGYEPVARALIVLALGWILAVLSAPAHMVAQAGGQVRASTAAAAATTVVAVGGAALLVRPRGLEGVVAAQSLGLAAGAVLMWVLFCRGFNCGWRDLGLPRWRPIAAAVAGAVLARLVVAQLSPSLLTLAVAAGAGLALYGGAMLASREVSEVEAELARQVLRRPTSQRSGAPNETRRGAATDATAEPLAGLVVEHDEAAGDTPAKPPDEDGSPCG